MHVLGIAITLFISLLVILLYFYIYKWVVELEREGCQCSDMWQRNFLNISTPLIIFISVISIFANVLMKLRIVNVDKMMAYGTENRSWLIPLYVAYIIFGICFIVILFDYTRQLKEMECVCSDSWVREYGYIYSLVVLILWSIAAGIMLFSMALAYWLYGSFEKPKSKTPVQSKQNKSKK